MKIRKKHPFLVIVLILVITSVLFYDQIKNSIYENESGISNISSENIKLANWNLQIFGDSKASNLSLMNFYASVIKDYDIIFIQEIRDIDSSSFFDLCNLLEEFECNISSRAGRSLSKEQNGVIYRKGVKITSFRDFNPDNQDRWERPPIEVVFNTQDYNLTVYNIHIKPDDAAKELDFLEEAVKDTSGNVVVLGDLNADCSYYDRSKENNFDGWNWLISDDQDTTSSSTNCAYDRIILNNDANKEVVSSGIYTTGINKEVSDHYLVWVELKDL